MKDDRLYLEHIRECIEKVERYTAKGREAFIADTMAQDATLRNLQILVESTQRISEKLKESRPEVPWREISGFRNVLAHDYLGIKLDWIWETIQTGLPQLKQAVSSILASFPGADSGRQK